MAVVAAILPVVSRSSSLTLQLYRIAAESQEAAKGLLDAAKEINKFALILKQLGTIIKEDDRLPSHAALETLEDIIEQSQIVLTEIDTTASGGDDLDHDRRDDARVMQIDFARLDSDALKRLEYLTSHLEALRTTLSVLLQTLYTAQVMIWSRLRPSISPQQTEKAKANERVQLETLIIQQQVSILSASQLYERNPRSDARLLMETDSSQSIIAIERQTGPNPVNLHRYQEKSTSSIDVSQSESEWLLVICSIASLQSERLLDGWTRLPQIADRLQYEEQALRTQQRETQQPTVESDSEEDNLRKPKLSDGGTRRSPPRSGSFQPLFTDAQSLPIPVPGQTYGPTAPMSPAASPRAPRNSVGSPISDSPTSPRSSIASLPVEAAAAIEAKEEDDDVDLEIPWSICTRRYYWKFIDAKQIGSNTDQPSSLAFLERNSWTEIMASWVNKDAIRERGYRVTQVQKERKDGRRTKFETCFCIEQPLTFDQVKHLVERTVQIYRRTAPPTPPPPQARRSSFQRPPPPSIPRSGGPDRDRTPMARNTHPPLERANSSMQFLPMPPPLDRSISMPGPGFLPPPPMGANAQPPNLQIPIPPGSYMPQLPPRPLSPRTLPYPNQAGGYPQQSMNPNSPQYVYPPNATFNNPSFPSHLQAHPVHPAPNSPLRQTYLQPMSTRRYDDATTSDSESGERERSRRHRSKSRNRYSAGRKKKSTGTSKAVGALMGVGGLTALLDGLSGL